MLQFGNWSLSSPNPCVVWIISINLEQCLLYMRSIDFDCMSAITRDWGRQPHRQNIHKIRRISNTTTITHSTHWRFGLPKTHPRFIRCGFGQVCEIIGCICCCLILRCFAWCVSSCVPTVIVVIAVGAYVRSTDSIGFPYQFANHFFADISSIWQLELEISKSMRCVNHFH